MDRLSEGLAQSWWFWVLAAALLSGTVALSSRYREAVARARRWGLARGALELPAGQALRPGQGFWSDLSWLAFPLAAWVVAGPWTWGYEDAQGAVLTDTLTGAAVAVIALGAVFAPALSALNLLAGLWLVTAPWLVGYGEANGPIGLSDSIAGFLLCAVAISALSAAERQIARVAEPRAIGRIRRGGDSGGGAYNSPPGQPGVSVAKQYVFIDEWDVDAPVEAVFNALADARTYPEWWKPVYISVEGDGPPEVGRVSRQHFKGRLPYTLRTTSEIVRMDRPGSFEIKVDGDLSGRGTWTLTPGDGSVHIRFDWRVNADRPLLRILTPLLRPAFRWNHNWAVARAREGLEPYARARA